MFKTYYKEILLFIFTIYISLILVSLFIYIKYDYPNSVYQENSRFEYCEKYIKKECQKKNRKYYFVEQREKNQNLAIYSPPIHSQRIKVFVDAEIYPLSGVSNSKTLVCSELGRYISISSDRYGFNNSDKVWNKNRIHIAIVGDSNAFGECVKFEDNITSNLLKKKFFTLSLGYGSNGPLSELASIREYVSKIKPEKVIWVFSTNDIEDLGREKNIDILLNYLNINFTQNLILKQKLIDEIYLKYFDDQILKAKESWPYRFSFIKILELEPIKNLINQLSRDKKITYYKIPEDDLKLFSKILSVAKYETESWGGEMIFMYLPAAHMFKDHKISKVDYTDQDKKNILKIVKENQIRIVDVEKKIIESKKTVDQVYALSNSHFTKEGYKIASEALISFLKKELN